MIIPNARPCPFCSSRNIIKGDAYFASCIDCGATGPKHTMEVGQEFNPDDYIQKWNKRPVESNFQHDIARLEERNRREKHLRNLY